LEKQFDLAVEELINVEKHGIKFTQVNPAQVEWAQE